MHADLPGHFTRLKIPAAGLFANDDIAGFYGPMGLWLFGRRLEQDQDADGFLIPVETDYDTWDQRPKMEGSGRAFCQRSFIVVSGRAVAKPVYTIETDEERFEASFDLSDQEPPIEKLPGVSDNFWGPAQERREFAPQISGTRFRHRITCAAPLEIHSLQPSYR
jgi:hypothetical protein